MSLMVSRLERDLALGRGLARVVVGIPRLRGLHLVDRIKGFLCGDCGRLSRKTKENFAIIFIH